MIEMGIRPELAPVPARKQNFLPPACYTLSKKKNSLLECLKSIKVQNFSNIFKKVSIKESKLIGMKSHDCHILFSYSQL
jgi:hypothetical protein